MCSSDLMVADAAMLARRIYVLTNVWLEEVRKAEVSATYAYRFDLPYPLPHSAFRTDELLRAMRRTLDTGRTRVASDLVRFVGDDAHRDLLRVRLAEIDSEAHYVDRLWTSKRTDELSGHIGETLENALDHTYEIGQLLAQKKIVARCAGSMEYGPRALGNRSILFHAGDPSVNDWLNKALRRDEFMPFAPATLRTRADDCYRGLASAAYAAEFMTVCFDCTREFKARCPAVVHVDGTARPQLVDHRANPGLHRILSAYEACTGIATVINTSFNIHEEPIVCTPQDAVRAFAAAELDYLALGNYLVRRPSVH